MAANRMRKEVCLDREKETHNYIHLWPLGPAVLLCVNEIQYIKYSFLDSKFLKFFKRNVIEVSKYII